MIYGCTGKPGINDPICGQVDVKSIDDACPKCGTRGNIRVIPI